MLADVNLMLHYQISFIVGRYGNGALFQRDFLATSEEVSAVEVALCAALRDHVQDMQVYRPNKSFTKCTAFETVKEIIFETGMEDSETGMEDTDSDLADITDLVAVAIEIDARSKGDEAEPWTLEFIWSNGGGDDNAYAQGFMGPSGAQALEKRFLARLDAAAGDFIRDIRVSRGVWSPEGNMSEALEDVFCCFERGGLNEAATAVRQAWAEHTASAGITNANLR